MLAWDAKALERQLQPWLPGLAVQVLPQCGSTNSTLLERARQAEREFPPTLLVAERQTAGRGRQGRGWVSEAGASLTFSLALALAPDDWSGLSLVVGLAVAEALDALPADARSRPRIGLKWPNDLWLTDGPLPSQGADEPAGRKLGGILVETVAIGPRRIAVVGIGLNVRPLAPERAATLGREVACLQECDAALTAPAALARLAVPLARALRCFEREGFAAFAAAYAHRDVLRGRAITTSDRQVPAGVAEGVADDGALLVRCDGRRHRIVSGEVSVRPAGPAGPAAAAAASARPLAGSDAARGSGVA